MPPRQHRLKKTAASARRHFTIWPPNGHWIFEKAKKSYDREGVLKMLGYAEKVVKNSTVASTSA
jgi:hypothetical protein